MNLAILGGSFNPLHIGHLYLADLVLQSFGYDRVILVPAFKSPFKLDAAPASPRDRLDMLASSIPGDPRLAFDDCEIRREGVSYTIDTVKDIIARYRPGGKIGLILGDDLASTFNKWKNPEELAELSDIIIARRLKEAPNCVSPVEAGAFPYPHRVLNNEIMDVSSRELRERIARGEAWRYLVPPGARHIIEERGLYGFNAAHAGLPGNPGHKGNSIIEAIISIENDVRSGLNFERFIHSRNTALMAWDLCRRFDMDPLKGYLAGIAHDMCKGMETKELFRLAHADGGNLSKLEKKKPTLLHARAAAVLIRIKYGITDKDIIEAIRYHTTGGRDMGPYAKVVYVADKIEVSRNDVAPVFREIIMNEDLETIFTAVLGDTVAYLKSHKLDISYGTKRLLTAMNKRNSK